METYHASGIWSIYVVWLGMAQSYFSLLVFPFLVHLKNSTAEFQWSNRFDEDKKNNKTKLWNDFFLHPERIKEIKQRQFEKIGFLSFRKFKLAAWWHHIEMGNEIQYNRVYLSVYLLQNTGRDELTHIFDPVTMIRFIWEELIVSIRFY